MTGLAHESCSLNASRDGGTLQTQKPKHTAFLQEEWNLPGAWAALSVFHSAHLALNTIFQHFFLSFFFFYLAALGLCCSTQDLQSHGNSVAACETWFPDQGLNLASLHWEHRVLAIGPPSSPPAFLSASWLYRDSYFLQMGNWDRSKMRRKPCFKEHSGQSFSRSSKNRQLVYKWALLPNRPITQVYQPYVRQWGVITRPTFYIPFLLRQTRGHLRPPGDRAGRLGQTSGLVLPGTPQASCLVDSAWKPRPPTPDGPPVRLGPGFAHTRGPDTLFPSCGTSSGLPQTSALTLSSLVRPPGSPFCCLKPRASPSLQFLKGHTDLGLNLSSGIWACLLMNNTQIAMIPTSQPVQADTC